MYTFLYKKQNQLPIKLFFTKMFVRFAIFDLYTFDLYNFDSDTFDLYTFELYTFDQYCWLEITNNKTVVNVFLFVQ